MASKFKRHAGYGMHEFFAPTTGRGNLNRRDRRRCVHYRRDTKLCAVTWIHCVGPTICKTYQEEKRKKTTREPLLGKIVINKTYGEGVITFVSGDICTVTYKSTKIQCKVDVVKQLLK